MTSFIDEQDTSKSLQLGMNILKISSYICHLDFGMTNLKNKISVFLKYLLLILFVSYYSGITLFYHAHLVNGEIIVHSHPFVNSKNKQSPFQPHSHSSASYFLIQQLMQTNWESSPDIPQIPGPVMVLREYKIGYTSTFIPSGSYSYAQLRAPPIG